MGRFPIAEGISAGQASGADHWHWSSVNVQSMHTRKIAMQEALHMIHSRVKEWLSNRRQDLSVAAGFPMCNASLVPLWSSHHALSIYPERSFIRLDMPPRLPKDIRPPDFVVEAVERRLLVLLGFVIEGSRKVPDALCSVPSRGASGHPKLLHAPMTEIGLLPSHQVSRVMHTVQ